MFVCAGPGPGEAKQAPLPLLSDRDPGFVQLLLDLGDRVVVRVEHTGHDRRVGMRLAEHVHKVLGTSRAAGRDNDGRFEQDPPRWLEAIGAALAEAMRGLDAEGTSARELAAISVTSTSGTVCALDSESTATSTLSWGAGVEPGGVMLVSLAWKIWVIVGPTAPASLCFIGITSRRTAGSFSSTSSFLSNPSIMAVSSTFAATSRLLVLGSGRIIGLCLCTSGVRAAEYRAWNSDVSELAMVPALAWVSSLS